MSFFSCFFLVSPLFDWSFGKLSPLDGMETRWNRGGGGGGGGGGGRRETEETVSREGPRGVKKTWWPSTLLLFLFLIPFFSFSILPLLLFLLFLNIQVEKWMERKRGKMWQEAIFPSSSTLRHCFICLSRENDHFSSHWPGNEIWN